MPRGRGWVAGLALLPLSPWALGQAEVTAGGIFEKALAAHRENREKSRYFVYREDVSYS
jgi:hypothetical protein